MAKINSSAVFAATLKNIKSSATAIRNDVQACLVYAFEQYDLHGNATFFNRIRATASSARAIPCVAIEEYITSHANVTYKDKKFTKTSKERKVKPLEGKWFDSINKENDPVLPKSTDCLKLVKSCLKQIGTKQEKELLNDDEKQVELAQAMLSQFIKAMEERGFEVTK